MDVSHANPGFFIPTVMNLPQMQTRVNDAYAFSPEKNRSQNLELNLHFLDSLRKSMQPYMEDLKSGYFPDSAKKFLKDTLSRFEEERQNLPAALGLPQDIESLITSGKAHSPMSLAEREFVMKLLCILLDVEEAKLAVESL